MHLIAIGGAGMSGGRPAPARPGCRGVGIRRGGRPGAEALRGSGARVHVGHDPAHVAGADTVVVSSAVREDNVELAAAARPRAAGAAPRPGARLAHG